MVIKVCVSEGIKYVGKGFLEENKFIYIFMDAFDFFNPPTIDKQLSRNSRHAWLFPFMIRRNLLEMLASKFYYPIIKEKFFTQFSSIITEKENKNRVLIGERLKNENRKKDYVSGYGVVSIALMVSIAVVPSTFLGVNTNTSKAIYESYGTQQGNVGGWGCIFSAVPFSSAIPFFSARTADVENWEKQLNENAANHAGI